MIRYWPYGPHGTTGNYLDGIGEIWRDLNAHGIPAFYKGVDGYGPLYELMLHGDAHGVENVGVFRLGETGGIQFGVPNWHAPSPEEAARQHIQMTLEHLPQEFDKRVWLEVINEPDKDVDESLGWTPRAYASWLGHFSVECARLLNERGIKHLAYGYSSGESELEDWEAPGQLAYLQYCNDHPDMAGLALHEYSYEPAVLKPYGWLVGRFERVFAICDKYNLRRPRTAITEFGWTLWEVPSPDIAVPQMRDAANNLYAKHPEILGVAIWHFGSGWKDIKFKAHKLLEPMHQEALTYRLEVDSPDIPEPPQGGELVIPNGSFEQRNWTHLTPDKRQQVPPEFDLEVQTDGHVRGRPVTTTPECVHKDQIGDSILPPDEWRGAENALILDGVRTYKIFGTGTWAANLMSKGVEVEPGERYVITINWTCHWDGRGEQYDPQDTEVIAYVLGGGKHSTTYMTHELDRKWVTVALDFVAPSSGIVYPALDVSVMYGHPTSFFTDNWTITKVDLPEQPDDCFGMSPMDYRKLAHVLPQDAPKALFEYVLNETYDRRESIMYSWHDACMGNLTNKTAVFWEVPEAERPNVIAWVDQNFPGTKVEFRNVPSAPPPEPQGVDLFPYFFPDATYGPTYELKHPDGGQERIQHQRDGNKLYIVKGFGGRDGKSEYEVLFADNEYIWRGLDTSPGGNRAYVQFETGKKMARWCKRFMREGETYFGAGHTVQFYNKADCSKSEPNSGPAQNVIKFVQRHEQITFNGIRLTDVIELSQPGGERWFFARGLGMVAWKSDWGQSAISELHSPGTRPDLKREELPCSFA